MPFGLTNAPAAFQRRMNQLLAPFIDKFAVTYLDDILIFSKTHWDHEKHVKQVFKVLNEADMILNLDKCTFYEREVKFLGHIISRDGIRPDPAKIQKIFDWPTPRNITDVRAFTNFSGFYCRYFDNFAKMSIPLTNLMRGSPKKGTSIEWIDKENDAFNEIKKQITSPPCLVHFQIRKPAYLDIDCSDKVIGSCLQQYVIDPDGKERLHPITFESKKLSSTEQRYSAQEREMLAAKYCLHHCRHLTEGSPIIVHSDHESLKGFRTQKHVTKRLVRFMNEIEHFDPIFVYRPGNYRSSQTPGLHSEGDPADMERLLEVESHLEGEKPTVSDLEHAKRVVEEVHLELGHYGKATIITPTKDRFSVPPPLLKKAARIIDACVPCQLYKTTPFHIATLHPYGLQKAFTCWALDCVGPLVKTKH